MHGKEKTVEVLQAQTAGFIAESGVSYNAKDVLFKHLGGIAVPDNHARALIVSGQDVLLRTDETEQLQETAEEGGKEVLHYEDYTTFLRGKGGSNNEALRAEADMLAAYHEFEPDVTAIQKEWMETRKADQHPDHLGSGAGSHAFSLQRNGRSYVALAMKYENPYAINLKLRGALRGKEVPRLEQTVAASYEHGVTIAERLPGKALDALTAADIDRVTEAQLGALIETLRVTVDTGIRLDFKPGNFLYDAQAGFGVIDYSATDTPQSLAEVLKQTAFAFSGAGNWAYSDEAENSPLSRRKIRSHNARLYAANRRVLETYRGVIAKTMPDESGREAVRGIDDYLAGYHQ